LDIIFTRLVYHDDYRTLSRCWIKWIRLKIMSLRNAPAQKRTVHQKKVPNFVSKLHCRWHVAYIIRDFFPPRSGLFDNSHRGSLIFSEPTMHVSRIKGLNIKEVKYHSNTITRLRGEILKSKAKSRHHNHAFLASRKMENSNLQRLPTSRQAGVQS
jgi:hypothetical protein